MRIRTRSPNFWTLFILLLVIIVIGISLIGVTIIDQLHSPNEYQETVIGFETNTLVATYKLQTIIAKSATVTPTSQSTPHQ